MGLVVWKGAGMGKTSEGTEKQHETGKKTFPNVSDWWLEAKEQLQREEREEREKREKREFHLESSSNPR